jgi:type I restriction-modification system DNA methylase subunit
MSLTTTFKRCLDILRDNEALTGDKALRNLSYLLILKMLEPTIIESEFLQYNFDLSDIKSDEDKNRLLNLSKFTEIAKLEESKLTNNLMYLWDVILSEHPSTKYIYLTNKFFEIKKDYTFYELIKILNKLDLSNIDYDVLGNVYEGVISEVMTGKTLGQFFTQPIVKKIMIDLINPQILKNGKIESVCDPTMGTGGFLISYINDIKNKAKQQNIKLNWENIKNNIFGQEIEPDTYQLGVSNMLISTGHMFDHLKCGDSIRDPIFQKFDNILANPPFGIKGLKYDDIIKQRKNISVEQYNEYIPIKANNAVSLFIQAIICMLKINGKCAVVIPDGQDLFSKTNKTLILIREYLLKTSDLKEIIYLPSGIFTYTSIKTCIFYFVKKEEGHDIVEINSKYNKLTGEEMSRKYLFVNEYQTKNIKFYEYNADNNTKTLLVDVSIEQLKNNKYSFNYNEYIEKISNTNYSNNIQIMTLGELCDIKIGGTPLRSNNDYYTNGYNIWVSVRELNKNIITDSKEKITDLGVSKSNVKLLKKDTILISFKLSIGKLAIAGCDLYTNEAIAGLNSKNTDIIKNLYLYYYLMSYDFKNAGTGLIGTGSMNSKSLGELIIPVPPLEHQERYIKYCENNQKEIENNQKEIENNQKEIENNIRIASEFLNKML